MDKANATGTLDATISIRNGPVQYAEGDGDGPSVNGNKRKSRSSLTQSVNYKDASDSDDQPIVSFAPLTKFSDGSVHADKQRRPNARGR